MYYHRLEASAMAGAFFETYVVSEIVKSIRNTGKRIENTLFYYRDRDQKEVDLIFIGTDLDDFFQEQLEGDKIRIC